MRAEVTRRSITCVVPDVSILRTKQRLSGSRKLKASRILWQSVRDTCEIETLISRAPLFYGECRNEIGHLS